MYVCVYVCVDLCMDIFSIHTWTPSSWKNLGWPLIAAPSMYPCASTSTSFSISSGYVNAYVHNVCMYAWCASPSRSSTSLSISWGYAIICICARIHLCASLAQACPCIQSVWVHVCIHLRIWTCTSKARKSAFTFKKQKTLPCHTTQRHCLATRFATIFCTIFRVRACVQCVSP